MATNILVVTHDARLGESIQQSLKDTGEFNVRVADETRKATTFLYETDCTLAFLDSGQNAKEMLEIGCRLRETRPAVRFVVIAEPGWQPALDELSPEVFLAKPFQSAELTDCMARLFPKEEPGGEQGDPTAQEPEMPAWLSDVNRAAQHLTRLTLGSSAQAALITNNQQLWAYAGHLPQTAARELAETISRYWDHSGEINMVRFVRLASTNSEHMLYATRLAPGVVLALVFDAETPFSTIRTQTNQLVHSLSDLPLEEDAAEAEEEGHLPVGAISMILSEVPPPNPPPEATPAEPNGRASKVRETFRKIFNPAQEAGVGEAPSLSAQAVEATQPHLSRETSPAVPLGMISMEEEQGVTQPHLALQGEDELAATLRSNPGRKNDPIPEDLGETMPSASHEEARKIVLEPASPSVYNLDYVCLLLPRFTHHHLTGDLSERLGEWIPQLCIAFGWRLEFISVRPEYLQWIASVPPASAPGNLMRLMRQHLSEKIFSEFPRFKRENPSGDFWAPGYLIMGGSQPPPTQLIKDYIAQTRQRQGFYPTNRR